MKPRPDIVSVDTLREYFNYSADTGIVAWAKSPRYGIGAGDAAGAPNSFGYIQICFKRRPYLAHRIGWALTQGHWPARMIDHINGDPADNRIVNLREVTGSQNQANRGVRKDSTTGLRGVRRQRSGKWSAQIQIGSFSTKEEASAAYLRLAEICYGEFAPTDRHPQSYAGRIIGGLDRA